MTATPDSPDSPNAPRTVILTRLWRGARLWVLASLFLLAQIIALALPILPTARVTIDAGEPAPQEFRAPYTKTYVSTLRTAAAREQAALAVPRAFTPPDTTIARQRVQRAREVLAFFDSVRADPYATNEQATRWLQSIPDVPLSSQTARQVLALNDGEWQNRVKPETLAVLDDAMRTQIQQDTLAQARQDVVRLVSAGLSEESAGAVAGIVQAMLIPNSFYDNAATVLARDAARNSVAPVEQSYARGDLIVPQNRRVTEVDIEALDQFGLRQPRTTLLAVSANVLVVLLCAVILALYVQRFHPDYWHDLRYLAMLAFLFTFWVVGARLTVPDRVVLPYLFPSAALAMLLTVMLETNFAIVVGILLSLVVGYLGGGSLELAAYTLAGSLVAALSLRNIERIAAFFWSGVFVGLAHAAVVLIFQLPTNQLDQDSLIRVATLLAAAFSNGLISSGITLAGLFVLGLGDFFDILTTIQLLELARPNHPLLQKILREAPGSYHHSLLVGNLAEQAAERIGADAALVRVGAFYHDAGKTASPYLFIENQMEGTNVHEKLDPYTSAALLIGHVREGVELARKHRLPRRVLAFIPEHHGTMRVSFLYQKALQAATDPAQVNEADFRYPGPRPQSRETAVLMLADGCEAAVRSIRPNSVDEIEQVVRRVVSDRVADGQLDECDLTLRDLNTIIESFVGTLKGVFHPRIQYPSQPAPVPPPQDHTHDAEASHTH